MTGHNTAIVGAVEAPYRRNAEGLTTMGLLAEAFDALLEAAPISPGDIDGLAVSSFSLRPDHAIDVAWQLGLRLSWIMEDPHGGAAGINMLGHAMRAIQAGDANAIVLLAADHLTNADARGLNDAFNSTVAEYLAPLPYGGPNSLFSLVTQAQMRRYGLERRDYGRICIAQRQWAALNPKAVYRAPLTMDDYLNAPSVAPPLGRFDCVPVVSGADALLLTRDDMSDGQQVRVRALKACHNYDQQEGDGLETGLSRIADALWEEAALGPDRIDVASVYDDYPAMVLAQLVDLGFCGEGTVQDLVGRIASRDLPVNTSGGQLSAGQAGAAGGMHGLVEVVTQLLGRAGDRQVPGARYGLSSGYGMVQYRYCQCANAVVMEARP